MKRYLGTILIGVNAVLAALLAWAWFGPGGQRSSHWSAPAPRTTDYEALVPPLGKPGLIWIKYPY